MRAATGYKGETIVDPQNLLAAELKRRGIVDVAVSEKKGYPYGMVQPAVLVGGKGGVWFTWAIVPSLVSTGSYYFPSSSSWERWKRERET